MRRWPFANSPFVQGMFGHGVNAPDVPEAVPSTPDLRTLSLIQRDPGPKQRTRRAIDIVRQILNSLIRQGKLVKIDDDDWDLLVEGDSTITAADLPTISPSPAGTYLSSNIVVDQRGRVTSASSGSGFSSGTPGSVLFVGTTGNVAQDNSNFFWDSTNHRLGIRTPSPSGIIHIVGNNAGAEFIVDTGAANSQFCFLFRDNGSQKFQLGIDHAVFFLYDYTTGFDAIYISTTEKFFRIDGRFECTLAGIPAFVVNSAGSYYGMVQNDAADTWSLAYGGVNTVLGTPVLQWTPTTVSVPAIFTVKMGTSTAYATEVGVANLQTSAAGVGNGADTSDDTLFTYSLPLNAMSSNGKSVRIRAWGSSAANANLKDIKLWFAGVTIADSGAIALNAADWCIEAEVARIDSTHVSTVGTWNDNGLAAAAVVCKKNQAVADLTANASVIKVSGASTIAGTASDVLGYGMKVWFEN